jgi:hypothetical protein
MSRSARSSHCEILFVDDEVFRLVGGLWASSLSMRICTRLASST